MHNSSLRFFLRPASRVILASVAVALFVVIAGCGGHNDVVAPPTPTPGTTSAQVRIGDAAADRVLFFSFKVGSPLTLTTTGGDKVVYDIGNNRWELTHMAGKFEPLSVSDLRQGSYSSVDLVVVSPGMVYLDKNGVPQGLLGNPSQNVTVNFSPTLTIGSTPLILNMDVNLANALATDANGFVTGFDFKSSSFAFSTKSIAAENEQQDDSGEFEGTTGKVTIVSGSTFTMEVGQGNTEMLFTTDGNTQFSDGVTNVASTLNKIVKVEGVTKADGTLYAKEVEGMENQSGGTVEGLITSTPSTAFQLELQDGNGNGMDPTKVGMLFDIDISALNASDFTIDYGKCDKAGLTVPGPLFPFDASHLHAGQRVEVETVNPVPAGNGTITANRVRLQQQALTGTVSNFVAGQNGAATFDLNLPTDGSSYMAQMLAANIFHVYQQPGTHNTFGAISNGSKLRVRGLLFYTAPGYNMIARRITLP